MSRLLTVMKPPKSVEEWEQGGNAQLRYLDPLLHYAEPFNQEPALTFISLEEHAAKASDIQPIGLRG